MNFESVVLTCFIGRLDLFPYEKQVEVNSLTLYDQNGKTMQKIELENHQ